MKITTKDMILTALFTALTIIGGYISIPIGAVPVTLQTFFTLLSGVILGAKLGGLSQIVYVILGLIGLPVFAGGNGGIKVIFSPTFGFILGFIIVSFIVGRLSESIKKVNFINIFIICLFGSIIIYLIGVPYLYIVLTKVMGAKVTFFGVFKTGCLVFLPGDLLKCIVISIISVKVIPSIKKATTYL